jgi:hypothetical protein
MKEYFSDRHPYIVFFLVVFVSFLFVLLVMPDQERDNLGCRRTKGGDGFDYQCRTAKLLEANINK